VKLLLDQNISDRLVEALADAYPSSAHVREVGLARSGDEAVWTFARERGYTIVSKDSAFHQRSFLFGFPPKVIWIRSGNCTTGAIEQILRKRQPAIQEFCEDQIHAFLILE
jgi:predicted nuclease of predicted toxin-antitoxin system